MAIQTPPAGRADQLQGASRSNDGLEAGDSEVWSLVERDRLRHDETLNFIASENYTAPGVLEALARRFPRYPTFVDKIASTGADAARSSAPARSSSQSRRSLDRAAKWIAPVAFEAPIDATLGPRRSISGEVRPWPWPIE